jgi:cytochrome c oxidase cbb3-type subunit III
MCLPSRNAIAFLVAMAVAGCERETRDFSGTQQVGQLGVATTRLTDLQAGATSPAPMLESPYHDNAYAMSEGKRLYDWFNCVGCHHRGGGGIGPALMDHRWIYGSRPDQIYSTIMQGRPDGMPSYGGRVTDQQAWQLVAYIESLSGNVPHDVAPSRNDDMQTTKPELRKEPEPPKQTGHR